MHSGPHAQRKPRHHFLLTSRLHHFLLTSERRCAHPKPMKTPIQRFKTAQCSCKPHAARTDTSSGMF
eukprot:563789-Rhodomonas_salina.2